MYDASQFPISLDSNLINPNSSQTPYGFPGSSGHFSSSYCLCFLVFSCEFSVVILCDIMNVNHSCIAYRTASYIISYHNIYDRKSPRIAENYSVVNAVHRNLKRILSQARIGTARILQGV